MSNRIPFEAMFRNYYRAVFSIFSRKGFSWEDSEDLSQKTFLRVYEHWDEYRGDAIWEYLVMTARSVLANHLRSRGAVKRGTGITGSLDNPGAVEKAAVNDAGNDRAVPSPMEVLEIQTHEAWLIAAIEELPKLDRRCILLRIGGRSFREIGKALRCSEQAAKTRCFRVREKLRKRWEDESQGEPRS